MKNQNFKAVILLILIILLVVILSRIQTLLLPKHQTSPAPTPTPTPILKTYKSSDNLFGFSYPSSWNLNENSSFTTCDAEILAISRTKDSFPKLDQPLSQIDGHRAFITSGIATASAIIESSSSGELIELAFADACSGDFESKKQNIFFSLLKYLKFYD